MLDDGKDLDPYQNVTDPEKRKIVNSDRMLLTGMGLNFENKFVSTGNFKTFLSCGGSDYSSTNRIAHLL